MKAGLIGFTKITAVFIDKGGVRLNVVVRLINKPLVRLIVEMHANSGHEVILKQRDAQVPVGKT